MKIYVRLHEEMVREHPPAITQNDLQDVTRLAATDQFLRVRLQIGRQAEGQHQQEAQKQDGRAPGHWDMAFRRKNTHAAMRKKAV